MRKIVAFIYLIWAGSVFVCLMLLVCPFIVLSTTIFPRQMGKRIAFFFLRIWACVFSWLSFFWVIDIHRNKIDTHIPYIYVGNHGSFLDAVAVAYKIPQLFSPLGKVEMVKIPVFGWIYSRVVILIDRSSKESREESVNVLKEEIKSGTSILIFPEGTMNRSTEVLAPFYDGAFRIAIETKTPILPFVLINNSKLLPRKNPLLARPGILKVVFGDPISVESYGVEDVEFLKLKVFKEMENMIKS